MDTVNISPADQLETADQQIAARGGGSRPLRCYLICMTPRSGSELLCEALAATGVAGRPTEHFWNFDGIDYPERFGVADYREALEHIYRMGTTPNGLFGVKLGVEGEFFRHVVRVLREALSLPEELSAGEVLLEGFPGLQIVTLTRRNKVRQAVSWWRAIQEDVWHVRESKPAPEAAAKPEYNFHRIDYLVQDLVMREASHQAFLETLPGPRPLPVVYEDFIAEYGSTVRRCLDYLGIEPPDHIPERADLVRQANAVNEEWVERYRLEKQSPWKQKAWLSLERHEQHWSLPKEPAPQNAPTLEILEVEKQRLDYGAVRGGHVGSPKPGMRSNSDSFEVAGWVLGKELDAVAVEIVCSGQVLWQAPLTIERPDIAAAFPDAPGANRSGFRITVAGLGREFELLVQGVLADERRLPLARITGRLS